MKKVFAIIIIILCNGCSPKLNNYSQDYFYMDTYINVNIYTNDEKKAKEALTEIDNIYKEYHQLTDRYNSYNNLKNVYYLNNKLKINESIIIDEKLYQMLEFGINYYAKSNGLVNIALGNVIDIWKKYRDQKEGVPSLDELKTSGSTNINDIVLDDDYSFTKKSNISIDLGAISKGYTTEKVGEYLESIGFDKYLINAGGNVKAGNHYKADKYKIGIEDPSDKSKLLTVITGNNISVVTSGGYERFYEYNGKKYHHIINPHTLIPPSNMLSVSVITKDSAKGDVLSTMLFLMPIDKGIKYINEIDDVEAIWCDMSNKLYYSKGFSKYE